MKLYTAAIIFLIAPVASFAEDNADSPAGQALETFVRDWIGEMNREANKQRTGGRFLVPAPTSDEPEIFTYTEYSKDYDVEMKETGSAAAPYVGILKYIEHTYTCRGPARTDCELVESSPITEIFPFKNGRWQY